MKRSAFLKDLLVASLAPAVVRAEDRFPEKQIRMVIPFAPGGTVE